MLAPRDQSGKGGKDGTRDAALYGGLVGLVVFILLLIVMPGWIAPFVFAVLAGALAAMFFLWSATDGFVKFNDDAAQRIAQRTGRGRATASGHLGAGDPGGVDPGMPVAADRPEGETAREAAEAFERTTDGAPSDSHDGRAGAGDPGGVDPSMPDPDGEDVSESAEAAASAFEDGDRATEGRKPRLLDAPEGGAGDDLKEIRGIGPKLEGMLHELGVWHFGQIASWGPEEVEWVDGHLEGFNGRVSRDEWVSQAKVLADGGQPDPARRADGIDG